MTDLDAIGAPAHRSGQVKIGLVDFAKTRRIRFFADVRMDLPCQAPISILYS